MHTYVFLARLYYGKPSGVLRQVLVYADSKNEAIELAFRLYGGGNHTPEYQGVLAR